VPSTARLRHPTTIVEPANSTASINGIDLSKEIWWGRAQRKLASNDIEQVVMPCGSRQDVLSGRLSRQRRLPAAHG